MFWISVWARRSASSMRSSETESAPHSTIMMASLVPATFRSSLLFSIWEARGFTTRASLM